MRTDLDGKIAVITGGGSGIGYAIAGALVEAGASVMVCDHSAATVASVNLDQSGIWALEADAADQDAIDALFAQLESRWGPADILVNNVGISGPTSWIEETPIDGWEETLRVNLTSAFLCTRRAVPSMKVRGVGKIINISSVAGRLGFPLRVAYSATKWGMIGMTKTLAMELGPFGISVNAILPGLVDNERADKVIAEQAEARSVGRDAVLSDFLSRISMRSRVTPEEIAAMVTYLSSTHGSHISGQSISICGNFETYANPSP